MGAGDLDTVLQVCGISILLIGVVSAWMVGLVVIGELYSPIASVLAIIATGIVVYGIGTLVKR